MCTECIASRSFYHYFSMKEYVVGTKAKLKNKCVIYMKVNMVIIELYKPCVTHMKYTEGK